MVSGAVGAALAVQNGIGFVITVFAIQLTVWQWPDLGPRQIPTGTPGANPNFFDEDETPFLA